MLSKAIDTAVKMETDAIQYYREAADKTAHPFGKRMFEGFVKEEQRHLKVLQDILAGLDLNTALSRPGHAIKTVFTEAQRQMNASVTASTDDMEAVRVALDFEKKGYNFYKNAAAEATGETEKTLLSRLANEEKEHFTYLMETQRYMTGTGEWYLPEEQRIIDEL